MLMYNHRMRLFGCWFIGWFAVCLFICLFLGWSISWSVGWISVGLVTDWSVGWFVGGLVHDFTRDSLSFKHVCSCERLFVRLLFVCLFILEIDKQQTKKQ